MTDKKTMPDLLPCPFCGIAAKNPFIECFDEETGIGGEFVYSPGCLNKNCILGSGYHCAFDEEHEAIAAWNTRTDLCANDGGVNQALDTIRNHIKNGDELQTIRKEMRALLSKLTAALTPREG